MPIMSSHDPDLDEVDIIFAGGGTVACVAAGRLAAASPDLRILLIEGGGGRDNFQDPTVVNPTVYLSHLASDSTTALLYKSRASQHLNDRGAIVATGSILGGGSSINFAMYTRAQGIDFDSWKTDGLAAKDMIPMCKKMETFHQDDPEIDRTRHGYDGPIHVSNGGYRGESEIQFKDTIKSMGFREIVDLQDFEAVRGFSKWQRYVSLEGKRQDSAHCYIHPLLKDGKHPNLHVLVESRVICVVFGKSIPPRAVGVEYRRNQDTRPDLAHIIKAKKLVVVFAGALGTPQILERCGVGDSEPLKKHNIPVVSYVPGVGEDYQDHQLILYPYRSSLEPSESLDPLISGCKDLVKAVEEKDPQLGWNGVDVCSKLRMTNQEAAALGSGFQQDWEWDFVPYPTRPVILCAIVNAFLGDPSLLDPVQYFTKGVFTAYPHSHGSMHINDPQDVLTGYDFDAGFFSHPSDIKKQLWGYKIQREIARRLQYYRGEIEIGNPKFPVGSRAAPTDPGCAVRDDIEYSSDADALIEDWIRSNVNTTWHSLGTCAMKPFEDGGVVYGNLNVYGMQGLKLADLSIVPVNVAANTNNTALAVGENALTSSA